MRVLHTRSQAFLLGVSVAAAALHLLVASRWHDRVPFVTALAAGWGGALWLTWLDRRSRHGLSNPAEKLMGAVLFLAALSLVLSHRAEYSLIHRFLPGLCGVGLVVTASGIRSVRQFWREVVLLSLTLVYPLPFALQQLLMPTRLTASTTSLFMNVLGFETRADGMLLVFPHTTLRVYDACSGMVLMTQMLLLAVLVVCFFPMTLRRAARVVFTAVVTGFLVNVARITMLGIVAWRASSDFAYWEQYVAGSVLFPVVATALAGGLWWRMLRARPTVRDCVVSSSRPPPATDG